MAKQRHTTPEIAKIASKVLKDGRSGTDAKKLAASVLSQNAPKKKKS